MFFLSSSSYARDMQMWPIDSNSIEVDVKQQGDSLTSNTNQLNRITVYDSHLIE